ARAALLRAVLCIWIFAGLALGSACAGYSRKPLSTEEYRQVLERRTSADGEVVDGVADAAYAPGDGLRLHEAELLALYLNPRLRSARQEAQVFAASARYADLWQDPEIGAEALRILEDVEEPWISGATLSFTIPVSGRLA